MRSDLNLHINKINNTDGRVYITISRGECMADEMHILDQRVVYEILNAYLAVKNNDTRAVYFKDNIVIGRWR
jgi:hypothetical protein